MRTPGPRTNPSAILLAALLLTTTAIAEEGMWTFDNPPTAYLKDRYGFEPDQAWLDHVRLASVRFMDGGSGAFVSPYGLVATNHHVVASQLQKVSTADRNLMSTGFYAKELTDEIPCPDLEANVLVELIDVTAQVAAQKTAKARLAEQARIARESQDKTKLLSEVVELYHGGEYWLYRYQKYTDVRLVFAPEGQAAAYGGDWDNFTYPRHSLDVAFVRVYDQGKPLNPPHYLRWSKKSVENGELVFVTGHPGQTDRMLTNAQLAHLRDGTNHLKLQLIDRSIAALEQFAEQGREHARRARTRSRGFQNSHKAFTGMQRALTDERTMTELMAADTNFKEAVLAKKGKRFGDPWARVENTLKKYGKRLQAREIRELAASRYGSRLLRKAVRLALYTTETIRPDGERLEGFHDAELERMRFQILSPAPLYPDLEAVMMDTSFRFLRDKLGKKDPMVLKITALLDDPQALGKLTAGTRLTDPDECKRLLEGGAKAVTQSKDPLMVLARDLAVLLAEDERWQRKVIDSVITPATSQIARARFDLFGKDDYPDATFTLRMTFGKVSGYPMNGTLAPYRTTLHGLYDRALGFDKKGDWSLPERFWKRKKLLDLTTPVNFVAECDIIGGNSGSPVLNKKGEFVGVVFDINIEALSNAYLFDETVSRGVAVDVNYITHALEKLYDATDLVDELTKR